MTPTPEQLAIIAAARSTSANLIIDALAGTGKTSLLVSIADATQVPTLAISFSKPTAVELQSRMPSHCVSSTLHSVGMKAVGRWYGRKLAVKDGKKGDILKAEIDTFSGSAKDEAWKSFKDILDAVKKGAAAGWLPQTYQGATALLTDEEFIATLDFAPSALEWRLIRSVTKQSIDLALHGTIDFSDMILLPALWPIPLQSYALTVGDEVQDWSELDHRFIQKLVGKYRFMGVGDPCQAIYGFRGAHQNSMDVLEQMFHMERMPLSISFRCPTAIAEHVRWRAPRIASPEWAKPGSISVLEEWSASTIPDGAAILCRNNAPTLGAALRLIRAGRRPQVLGNDITKGLVKMLKAISKDLRLPSADAWEAFQPEASRLRRRYRDAQIIEDKISCIEHFLTDQPTLGLAIASAERIMECRGPIQLATVHKSKGLEFDNVFILDEFLIRDEGQDRNIRYVAATRAKESLTYITSKGYVA